MELTPTKHDTFTFAKCPVSYAGPLKMLCFDGSYYYTDQTCGNDCSSGSIEVGGSLIEFKKMKHNQIHDYSCIAPQYGTVQLRCDNTVVRVHAGNCIRDCNI